MRGPGRQVVGALPKGQAALKTSRDMGPSRALKFKDEIRVPIGLVSMIILMSVTSDAIGESL